MDDYYYSVPESGIRFPAEEKEGPAYHTRDKVMQLFNAGVLRQVTMLSRCHPVTLLSPV